MPQDYTQMWSELGLDLEAHDALLNILGKAYQDIFLSQKNRPASMNYFDTVMSEIHGQRIKELVEAKKQGRKIVGSYCVFVPEELIMAVDGISVGLCAGAEFNFAQAEKLLPRSTCALIKSAFGFGLGKVCPYLEACDMVVGENTCDGKKKSYELLKDMVNNLYVIDLPQIKSENGKTLLKAEYKKFLQALQKISGKTIDVTTLKQAIQTVNSKRQAVKRLAAIRQADPAPISGLDALLINQVFFYDDPQRFTASVNKICDELEKRVEVKQGVTPQHPRIIISGCPMAVPNWKIPHIVESSGGIIVAEESCVGARGARWLTEESGETVDELLDNITDRYFQIDCAVFTPNPSRLEYVKELVKTHRADGVIHYALQFCQPYQIESGMFEQMLEAEDIPALKIETDYSQEDMGQLKTRIEAFIERIKE